MYLFSLSHPLAVERDELHCGFVERWLRIEFEC